MGRFQNFKEIKFEKNCLFLTKIGYQKQYVSNLNINDYHYAIFRDLLINLSYLKESFVIYYLLTLIQDVILNEVYTC